MHNELSITIADGEVIPAVTDNGDYHINDSPSDAIMKITW